MTKYQEEGTRGREITPMLKLLSTQEEEQEILE